MITHEQIAYYYDQNTLRFLSLGGSGETAAIHRQIWAPGVKKTDEAFLYLNKLIAERFQHIIGREYSCPRILDLGCGVGGTALWLAEKFAVDVIGVTNSETQHHLAMQRASEKELTGNCKFILANFHHLPPIEHVHAAYAIESFVHARDANDFFEIAAYNILPGGHLVICDDFLADNAEDNLSTVHNQSLLQTYKRGWQISNLVSTTQAIIAAEKHGLRLVRQTDLTNYIRVSSPIKRKAMLLFSKLTRSTPYRQNLQGGVALQACIKLRLINYQVLEWEKIV